MVMGRVSDLVENPYMTHHVFFFLTERTLFLYETSNASVSTQGNLKFTQEQLGTSQVSYLRGSLGYLCCAAKNDFV